MITSAIGQQGAPQRRRERHLGRHHVRPHRPRRELAVASIGALGVVYGDIGTSPLYAITECLAWGHSPHAVPADAAQRPRRAVAGVLVADAGHLRQVPRVRAARRQQGRGRHPRARRAGRGPERNRARAASSAIPILLGLFGAGLLFGDGAITPAISVLGAIEGLSEQSSGLGASGRADHRRHPDRAVPGPALRHRADRHRVRPGACWSGSSRSARSACAGSSSARTSSPRSTRVHGVVFLATQRLPRLPAPRLGVPGRHRRRGAVRRHGPLRQVADPHRVVRRRAPRPAAQLLRPGRAAARRGRWARSRTRSTRAVEGPLLIPMLVLATMAAIIASQALISGVFSLTRQAMQLGFWPRVTVVHTSAQDRGPDLHPRDELAPDGGLPRARASSSARAPNLAAAYGIAVTGTMAITSYLFYLVARKRWGYSHGRGAAADRAVPRDRSRVLLRERRQDPGRRLVPARRRAAGVHRHDDVVARPHRAVAADRDHDPRRRHVPRRHRVAPAAPRPRHRGVHDVEPRRASRTSCLHHVKHNQVLHEQVVLFSVDHRAVAVGAPGEGRRGTRARPRLLPRHRARRLHADARTCRRCSRAASSAASARIRRARPTTSAARRC